jgi:hypothetical protein
MWVDIVAAAVKCGLTRIASINQSWPFVASYANYGINTEGTWHQGVAHTGNQELLSENLRNIFAYGVLLLAQKLDVEESGGRTFLDNSLIIMTQECGGELTHQGADYSTLTVGSAGGFFKTGQYFDLRRMDPSARWTLYGNTMGYTGPMYNQLLAIILQSMGLPRSEFEVGGQQGYGRVRIGPSFAGRLVPDAITQASRMIAAAKA